MTINYHLLWKPRHILQTTVSFSSLMVCVNLSTARKTVVLIDYNTMGTCTYSLHMRIGSNTALTYSGKSQQPCTL